ncbi:MAG: hypothetical protein C0626_06980 [Arcobacter sp.]|uniref:hypothetical protein n=1 Tax=uncultured Arcobacter sp. TaxID=165434 RepID=UPI000CBD9179|nr:hypothetical protein [uncultured Arcobacter sp.]PLY10016.1 MAG: hypothetical protein C0626_06980 [Arcobacter sp.]
MSKSLNTNSVKSVKSEKIAATANQNKNAVKVGFSQERYENEQKVNARKAANLALAKEKAKKKAKMAKASKKKNKK